MSNEIEVGEYIRTDKGNIGKVIGIFDGHCTAKYHIEFQGNIKVKRQYLSTKTITNHSKNKINLVKAGDYVNGHKIIQEIWGEDDNELYFECEDKYNRLIYISENDIKSITTHEQFKSVEYIF